MPEDGEAPSVANREDLHRSPPLKLRSDPSLIMYHYVFGRNLERVLSVEDVEGWELGDDTKEGR